MNKTTGDTNLYPAGDPSTKELHQDHITTVKTTQQNVVVIDYMLNILDTADLPLIEQRIDEMTASMAEAKTFIDAMESKLQGDKKIYDKMRERRNKEEWREF